MRQICTITQAIQVIVLIGSFIPIWVVSIVKYKVKKIKHFLQEYSVCLLHPPLVKPQNALRHVYCFGAI